MGIWSCRHAPSWVTDRCLRSWSVQAHESILTDELVSKRRFHRLVTAPHVLVPGMRRVALTTTGSLPYKPASFWAWRSRLVRGKPGPEPSAAQPSNIQRQRRTSREADLSTGQSGAQAPARLPRPHGDQRRAQGRCRAARARTQAAQRLNSRRGAARPWSGSGIAPIFWPPRAEPKSQPRRSYCRRASEPRAVRSASASPCREKLEPPSSAIGCGAGSKKS